MSDVAYVVKLPDCDVHKYLLKTPGVPAHYDAKSVTDGRWGFMCESCFKIHGYGLGTGLATRLVVGESPSPEPTVEPQYYDFVLPQFGSDNLCEGCGAHISEPCLPGCAFQQYDQ